MNAVAFDTLKLARNLREKAKLSPEQAEGIADAMAEALQGDIATKADIAEVRSDIEALRLTTRADIDALRLSSKSDLEALSLRTKADLEAAKAEIIEWTVGTIGFQTVVVLGAVVALVRNLH